MRTPDFENNTLRILQGGKPERIALFELFMNDTFYRTVTGHGPVDDTRLGSLRLVAEAMAATGYDYATCNMLPSPRTTLSEDINLSVSRVSTRFAAVWSSVYTQFT